MALTKAEALAAAEAADKWPAGWGESWALIRDGEDWEEVDEDDPPEGAYG